MSKTTESPATLREAAQNAAKRFKASWVELAAILVRVRREQSYKQWDHPTFETYCARELFIKPATAQKLTRGYAFLEKHERELMSQPLDKIEPPPFEVIEVLARAEEREQFNDADYARLRDDIWKSEGTAQDRARTMLEQFPPLPPPPAPPATVLKRYAHSVSRLYDEVKPNRQVPAALKERLAALVQDFEELAKHSAEARA